MANSLSDQQPLNLEEVLLEKTAQTWDEYNARFSGRRSGLFWYDLPQIQQRQNMKVSGNDDVDWTQYTISNFLDEQIPLEACLSLGCGSGHLERKLARMGVFKHCDAYDVAPGSIADAQRLASEELIQNINYQVTDINRIDLPSCTYDAVWVHSAFHHFEALEHICAELRKALKKDGLLILNEYVGPNRFQFPIRQKKAINHCLGLLPTRYRTRLIESVEIELDRSMKHKGVDWVLSRALDKVRDGDLLNVIRRRARAYLAKHAEPQEKIEVIFPSVRDVIVADPSEAIRSQDILRILSQTFDIIEQTDLGGNILQFLLADIAGNFADGSEESLALLTMLFTIEDALLNTGELASDFAYIVARPK